MKTLSLTALVAAVLIAGCSVPSDSDRADETKLEYLTRHWVHSYEEEPQDSDVQIYRPQDFKEFPASRFRMQYIFYEDSDCKWYYLAPNDAHHLRDGMWRFDAEEKDVIHVEQGDQTVTYEIVELTEEVLRVISR